MQELLTLFEKSSPVLIALAALAYLFKLFLEKRITGIAARFEEIAKTSLAVKKDLRGEERSELVAFRVAVEKWEYFLQTSVFDFSMAEASNAKISGLYESDKAMFLDVRIAAVKACIYLRNSELERKLIDIIVQIRKHYYPVIQQTLPQLIDIQAKLLPIESKLQKFQASGMQDMAYAPTAQDREQNLALQKAMTEEMRVHAENLLERYRSVAQRIEELKEAVNQYIYRPIERAAIDRD